MPSYSECIDFFNKVAAIGIEFPVLPSGEKATVEILARSYETIVSLYLYRLNHYAALCAPNTKYCTSNPALDHFIEETITKDDVWTQDFLPWIKPFVKASHTAILKQELHLKIAEENRKFNQRYTAATTVTARTTTASAPAAAASRTPASRPVVAAGAAPSAAPHPTAAGAAPAAPPHPTAAALTFASLDLNKHEADLQRLQSIRHPKKIAEELQKIRDPNYAVLLLAKLVGPQATVGGRTFLDGILDAFPEDCTEAFIRCYNNALIEAKKQNQAFFEEQKKALEEQFKTKTRAITNDREGFLFSLTLYYHTVRFTLRAPVPRTATPPTPPLPAPEAIRPAWFQSFGEARQLVIDVLTQPPAEEAPVAAEEPFVEPPPIAFETVNEFGVTVTTAEQAEAVVQQLQAYISTLGLLPDFQFDVEEVNDWGDIDHWDCRLLELEGIVRPYIESISLNHQCVRKTDFAQTIAQIEAGFVARKGKKLEVRITSGQRGVEKPGKPTKQLCMSVLLPDGIAQPFHPEGVGFVFANSPSQLLSFKEDEDGDARYLFENNIGSNAKLGVGDEAIVNVENENLKSFASPAELKCATLKKHNKSKADNAEPITHSEVRAGVTWGNLVSLTIPHDTDAKRDLMRKAIMITKRLGLLIKYKKLKPIFKVGSSQKIKNANDIPKRQEYTLEEQLRDLEIFLTSTEPEHIALRNSMSDLKVYCGVLGFPANKDYIAQVLSGRAAPPVLPADNVDDYFITGQWGKILLELHRGIQDPSQAVYKYLLDHAKNKKKNNWKAILKVVEYLHRVSSPKFLEWSSSSVAGSTARMQKPVYKELLQNILHKAATRGGSPTVLASLQTLGLNPISYREDIIQAIKTAGNHKKWKFVLQLSEFLATNPIPGNTAHFEPITQVIKSALDNKRWLPVLYLTQSLCRQAHIDFPADLIEKMTQIYANNERFDPDWLFQRLQSIISIINRLPGTALNGTGSAVATLLAGACLTTTGVHGDFATCVKLSKDHNPRVNDIRKLYPLHTAIEFGKGEFVLAFCESKKDIHASLKTTFKTTLITALQHINENFPVADFQKLLDQYPDIATLYVRQVGNLLQVLLRKSPQHATVLLRHLLKKIGLTDVPEDGSLQDMIVYLCRQQPTADPQHANTIAMIGSALVFYGIANDKTRAVPVECIPALFTAWKANVVFHDKELNTPIKRAMQADAFEYVTEILKTMQRNMIDVSKGNRYPQYDTASEVKKYLQEKAAKRDPRFIQYCVRAQDMNCFSHHGFDLAQQMQLGKHDIVLGWLAACCQLAFSQGDNVFVSNMITSVLLQAYIRAVEEKNVNIMQFYFEPFLADLGVVTGIYFNSDSVKTDETMLSHLMIALRHAKKTTDLQDTKQQLLKKAFANVIFPLMFCTRNDCYQDWMLRHDFTPDIYPNKRLVQKTTFQFIASILSSPWGEQQDPCRREVLEIILVMILPIHQSKLSDEVNKPAFVRRLVDLLAGEAKTYEVESGMMHHALIQSAKLTTEYDFLTLNALLTHDPNKWQKIIRLTLGLHLTMVFTACQAQLHPTEEELPHIRNAVSETLKETDDVTRQATREALKDGWLRTIWNEVAPVHAGDKRVREDEDEGEREHKRQNTGAAASAAAAADSDDDNDEAEATAAAAPADDGSVNMSGIGSKRKNHFGEADAAAGAATDDAAAAAEVSTGAAPDSEDDAPPTKRAKRASPTLFGQGMHAQNPPTSFQAARSGP